MAGTTNEIFEFIEETLEKSESVLVHSARGQSRASAVIAIYMMKKYKWTLLKTLEFLNSRRPDLEIRANFIQQLNMFETYLNKCGFGPKTQDWNEISENTFYIENEELLLRNTFLNARMGPLAEYDQTSINSYKPPNHERIVWADERRLPLALEGADEDDLVNKTHVRNVMIHHEVDSAQLRSSISSAKKISFGPKYKGDGKLDFYSQNQFPENEQRYEEFKDAEIERQGPPGHIEQIQRAKFVPVANTRPNDLNTVNKKPLNTKQAKKPSYQPKNVTNNADMRRSQENAQFSNYYPLNSHMGQNSQYNQQQNNHGMVNQMHQTKIKPNMQPQQQPNDELDSRNEIFAKAQSDPLNQKRKPLGTIQNNSNKYSGKVTKEPAGYPHGSNTGNNRNSKPRSQNNQKIGMHGHHGSNGAGHRNKESHEQVRRSNSLKVKKENDKISNYNKQNRGSHRDGSGSFVVPSSNTNKKSNSLPKKNTKEAGSASNMRTGYSKGPSASNTSGPNKSGHYRLGSGYGMRNTGGSNFSANTRVRKAGSGNPAHNTMASFRSGPVRVVNDKSEGNPRQSSDSHKTYQRKDASKRPSSASKATKPTSKIVSKSSNRPGTASTRTNSNRPPSPGSRSMKSDQLFSSYSKHK